MDPKVGWIEGSDWLLSEPEYDIDGGPLDPGDEPDEPEPVPEPESVH